MMDIGKMDYLVIFEERLEGDDGHGNPFSEEWGNPVAADAAFRFLRGGESVQAARLSGRQPIVATVHNNSTTRAVTTDWRMKNGRTGEVFNIRTGPVPTGDHQYLEFTVEGGVAV